MVVYACNPSYSGGKDRKIEVGSQFPGESIRSYLKNKAQVLEGKCEALSSNPSTAKNKQFTAYQEKIRGKIFQDRSCTYSTIKSFLLDPHEDRQETLGHFGGIPDKLTFSAGFVTAQLALFVD
jgi:hypothetical protein